MKGLVLYLACIAGALVVAGLMTYGLASIGEPQSSWLWCDIIGACPGGDQ